MDCAPRPVLSYASPVNAESADVPTAMDLTFERPSVAQETTLYVIALALCCLALVIIAGMFISNLLEGYAARDRLSKLIATGVGFTIVGGMAMFLAKSMIRLRRFGAAPVRIVIDRESVTLSDPVRLGPQPLTVPLGAVRGFGCTRKVDSRYSIFFVQRGSWRRKRIDVTAHERGVVERAVADLQRAIDQANGKN